MKETDTIDVFDSLQMSPKDYSYKFRILDNMEFECKIYYCASKGKFTKLYNKMRWFLKRYKTNLPGSKEAMAGAQVYVLDEKQRKAALAMLKPYVVKDLKRTFRNLKRDLKMISYRVHDFKYYDLDKNIGVEYVLVGLYDEAQE